MLNPTAMAEPTEYLVSVSVILKGPELDPDQVSTAIGISPTDSQRRGDKVLSESGLSATRKHGLWSLTLSRRTSSISEVVEEAVASIGSFEGSALDLPGVKNATLDIFAAVDSRDGRSDFDLTIRPEQVGVLARLGLSLSVTMASIPT